MDKRKHTILVKDDMPYEHREYVQGRISGLMVGLCYGDPYDERDYGYSHTRTDEGLIMVVDCAEEVFTTFKDYVEKLYPNVCKFDI